MNSFMETIGWLLSCLSLHCPLGLSSRLLASPLIVLSLHRPLIVSLRRLVVVASPLVAPPSCPLVAPHSRHFVVLSLAALLLSHCAIWLLCRLSSHCGLVLSSSSHCATFLSSCALSSCSHCATLSSSCAGWLLCFLSLRHPLIISPHGLLAT